MNTSIDKNNQEHILRWISLSQIKGINNDFLCEAMQTFNNPLDFINLHRGELELMGLKNDTIRDLKENLYLKESELEYQEFVKKGGKIMSILDPKYPLNLKLSPYRIPLIYYFGDIKKIDREALAIVGTRSCSSYGSSCLKSLIEQLSQYQMTVISGMAYGIDRICHYSSIENNIRNIAVLGQGLLTIKGSSNLNLVEKISDNGAVISQFNPMYQARNFTFPLRNATISGISKAVAVIESKLKGGALITAACTQKEKKKIFALPGNISNINSQGCNQLLYEGAIPLINIDAIINHLAFRKKNIQNTNKLNLNMEESKVIQSIKNDAVHLDEIISMNNISLSKVLAILTTLELKNVIEPLPGKFFRRKNI